MAADWHQSSRVNRRFVSYLMKRENKVRRMRGFETENGTARAFLVRCLWKVLFGLRRFPGGFSSWWGSARSERTARVVEGSTCEIHLLVLSNQQRPTEGLTQAIQEDKNVRRAQVLLAALAPKFG